MHPDPFRDHRIQRTLRRSMHDQALDTQKQPGTSSSSTTQAPAGDLRPVNDVESHVAAKLGAAANAV